MICPVSSVGCKGFLTLALLVRLSELWLHPKLGLNRVRFCNSNINKSRHTFQTKNTSALKSYCVRTMRLSCWPFCYKLRLACSKIALRKVVWLVEPNKCFAILDLPGAFPLPCRKLIFSRLCDVTSSHNTLWQYFFKHMTIKGCNYFGMRVWRGLQVYFVPSLGKLSRITVLFLQKIIPKIMFVVPMY